MLLCFYEFNVNLLLRQTRTHPKFEWIWKNICQTAQDLLNRSVELLHVLGFLNINCAKCVEGAIYIILNCQVDSYNSNFGSDLFYKFRETLVVNLDQN